MATYTKSILSASIGGRQILVNGTSSGSATSIHTATSNGMDEIYLYAFNNTTASISCSILWGGTTEPDDAFKLTLPSNIGRVLLTDGKLLQNGLTVQAYSNVSSSLIIDGFINNIASTNIDPLVTAWAQRVILNGGTATSSSTQLALTSFVQGLEQYGLLGKMVTINCFVPDGLVAVQTPLYSIAGYNQWVNHSFVSTDLTINGLKGDGSGKYLDTGIIPSSNFNSTNNVGVSAYVSSNNSNLAEFDIGAGNSSGPKFLELFISYGGSDYFDTGNNTSGQGRVSGADSAFLGFISGNRTSANTTAIYHGNSTTPFATVASDVGNPTTGLPTVSICFFADNVDGAFSSLSSKRFSFGAIHFGLSNGDSQNLFNLVQAMRVSLGGGYV